MIQEFYENNLSKYGDYLADVIFCGDKTLATGYTAGYKKETTYYAVYDRLYKNTDNVQPTLKCAEGASNTYSRYTVKEYITAKNVTTNGNLTYPVALLSADELVMAGAYLNKSNSSYLLEYSVVGNTQALSFWTMTPYRYDSNAVVSSSIPVSDSLTGYKVDFMSTYSVRPVINLKADVLVDSGDGTSANPYTVKIS